MNAPVTEHRRRLGSIVGACLLTAASIGAAVVVTDDTTAAPSRPAETAPPQGAARVTTQPGALTPRTINALQHRSIHVLQGFGQTVALDVAQRSASGGLGSMTAGNDPAEAQILRVTAPKYGKELEADPTKPSRIDPIVKDRLAWVLVYDDAQVPISGPITMPHKTSGRMEPVERQGPDIYDARLAVIIDAATGEFLLATTL